MLALFGASCAFGQAETTLILPFFNLSKGKNIDWIGDSISETLVETLASEGMDVIRNEQRDQALREAGVRRYAVLTQASVAELAVMVSAGVAVAGDFDVIQGPEGAHIRLRARIIEVRKVQKGKELEVSGPLEQLSVLQTSLAWLALKALHPSSSVTEESFQRSHPPIRLDALESYARGLLATGADERLKLFAAATRLEPGFGLAQFQMGLALYQRRDYRLAAEAFSRVPVDSVRGREALFHLGLARFHQGEFSAAARAWRSLAEQVPMAEVLNNLGAALLRSGDLEAVTVLEKTVETDPSDPVYHFNLGYALWRSGQFDRAAGSFRLALERRPDDEFSTLLLGRCLQKTGPRPGDLRFEAAERLKTEYNESAYLALKAMLKEGR
jgi:tetratricopeptide (TPR) repeat protein